MKGSDNLCRLRMLKAVIFKDLLQIRLSLLQYVYLSGYIYM
ncbi:Uncharacterised protein [Haemophilus paraphrohaemolyticus]|nr:Uncharacterised protein [Haemophilus paraphrohaemolyticus]